MSATAVKHNATSIKYWARRVRRRTAEYSQQFKAIRDLFNAVADKLEMNGKPEDVQFVKAKKDELFTIRKNLRKIREDQRAELGDVVERSEIICKEGNRMMKGLKVWMRKRPDVQAAFYAVLKRRCEELKFNFYKGISDGRGRKKIHANWSEFVSLINCEVTLLARALGKIPILCKPCLLIFFGRRSKLNPKIMIDLSKIFTSSIETDLEGVKMNFVNALFKKNADDDKEDLLKQFEALKMPQIALPGKEHSKAKYHECLKKKQIEKEETEKGEIPIVGSGEDGGNIGKHNARNQEGKKGVLTRQGKAAQKEAIGSANKGSKPTQQGSN